MAKELLDDPLGSTSTNNSLTPLHILVLLFACLSLILSNMNLPSELRAVVGMWKRAMLMMIVHHIIVKQIESHKKRAALAHVEEKSRYDPLIKSELKKKPDDWEHASSHPSHFLTTRDGKPRLFPFPLGLAGGSSAGSKELWWEAGNSAHVGHFNQRETPEAREQLRKEMQGKEAARQKQAKKRMKEYESTRKKWQKRLSHLKVISGIVVICVFHRPTAVVCLAALIYYIFATELAAILQPKKEEKDEPAKKRKKIPTTAGMALTYIYEPTKDGSVQPTMGAPTKAPSNRLTTSFDSRYAS